VILKDYLDLITSEFRDQPNFIATLTANLDILLRIQDVLSEMIPDFDVDVAVGAQLDIIGKWVGITRNVAIPITGVYFAWDSDATVGWEYGTWQPSDAPVNVTTLPDDAYRTLIKAKIAANSWDGTTDGAYAIWDQVFKTTTILIQDNQDMSYALAVVGGVIDSLTLALITGGYIPLKPEGVRVNIYYVSVDSGPVFGWDVESDLLGGWDEASWVRELTPT
jgi:hypothetical protein